MVLLLLEMDFFPACQALSHPPVSEHELAWEHGIFHCLSCVYRKSCSLLGSVEVAL